MAPPLSAVEHLTLFQAVMREDIGAIRTLLMAGARLNERNACGLTPLALARERGKLEAAAFLETHGPAHLRAVFGVDERAPPPEAPRVDGWSDGLTPQASPQASAKSLQVYELELRHPEHRPKTLERMLSWSGMNVDEVSVAVEEHAAGVDREKAQAQRGRAHRRLRRGLPTGQRLRLNGIAAMHEVDFQELVEQLAGLAKVKDAEEEDPSPKPKHDWRTQLADKSPPAERCPFGESNRGEIPRPAEVPKAEKPHHSRRWFPENEPAELEPPEQSPAAEAEQAEEQQPVFSEEDEEEELAQPPAERPERHPTPQTWTARGLALEEEEEEEEDGEDAGEPRSLELPPEECMPLAKTTAHGKIKNYGHVGSRIDARRTVSASASKAMAVRLPSSLAFSGPAQAARTRVPSR